MLYIFSVPEEVEHIILHCPSYVQFRNELQKQLNEKNRNFDLATTLCSQNESMVLKFLKAIKQKL